MPGRRRPAAGGPRRAGVPAAPAQGGAPRRGATPAGAPRQFAAIPLVFQPGSEWNYGVSTDVLGRLVEVLSGQSLDEFFQQRIFAPLGMRDTSFGLRPDDDVDSLAKLYLATPGQPGGPSSGMMFSEAFDAAAHTKPDFLSGG